MARTIRDASLETRTARARLKPRGKPYYRAIEPGLHLGYRRPLSGAGKWVVRHYAGDEAYKVETLATADDFSDADGIAILSFAQAQVQARTLMVERARHAAGKAGPYTVAMAIGDYLEFLESEGRAAHTIRDAQYRAKALILPKLGNIEVAALTVDQLRGWRNELVKAKPRVRTAKGSTQNHLVTEREDATRKRQATANRTWTILRAAFNHAFHSEKVPSADAWQKVKPFKAVDAARGRYLTIAEAKRLINGSDKDFRLMVQAGLQTGARYSELARLTVSDFNPDVGTLHVRQSKSGKPRHIVLTREGIDFFRQLAAGRPGDAIMLTKADGSAWAASHQLRPMAEAVTRARISPPISFHGLRHTWASLAVMNGMPLMVVAKNLGHSDTRMVEKHYGHLAESYVVDAIRSAAPQFGFKPDRKIAAI